MTLALRLDVPAPQRVRRTPRVGVVNLMPRAETYEPLIRAALGRDVEIVWLRLDTHGYRSSDPAHLAQSYVRAADAARLDALLLTGAPVETLPFSEVRYWDELRALLERTRAQGTAVMGVCWGAMALAKLHGIEKETLPRKVFGAYEDTLTLAGRRLLPGQGGRYRCAQSRHAGIVERDVQRAEREGRVVVLARGEESGTTLLASADGAVLMHLGHPEYEPSRIAYEWSRDRAAGREDVRAPRGFDAAGERVVLPWERDSRALFRAWRETFEAHRAEVVG